MSDSPFSFSNTLAFLNRNFGILLLLAIVGTGGYLLGNLMSERTGVTKQVAQETGAVAGVEESRVSDEQLIAKAITVGIKESDLQKCLDSGEFTQKINDQMTGGTQAGINGTPGTVIVVDGVPVELIGGALPFADYTGQDGTTQPGVQAMIAKYLDGSAPIVADATLANMPAVSGDDHLRGSAEARIKLVEYSDFECPYCQRFDVTMQQVMSEFGDEVAWVYRHFPLSFHPQAQPAAEASECVAKLGGDEAFWNYADLLYAE